MKTKAKISSRWLRFRALLIDIFLIYVPILYLFYFLLGSKEAFLNNHFITTLCTFLFGLIQAIFLTKKAQSPGLKAYDLYLIDIKTGKKLSFLRILLRYVIFIISFASIKSQSFKAQVYFALVKFKIPCGLPSKTLRSPRVSFELGL